MSPLRAVYTNLALARTTIRDIGRFRQIAGVLVRHGFGFLLSRFSRKDPAVARAVDAALQEEPEIPLPPPRAGELARRARQVFEELGPTFIKFGQILSTRPDLVPPELSVELQGLQDDVPPMPYSEVKKVIREELGLDPEEIFAELTEKPLAAASVAQVHRARLKTGEEVAVKVQRPGILKTIEADLDILYFLARQVMLAMPDARLFDPPGIVAEFEKALRKELDFLQEGRNIQRFARNFEGVDYIHVPAVYKAYTTARVLTMEFVAGRKVTDAVAAGEADGEVLARHAAQALFKQFFRDGFFHGDLHPGNMLVLPGNRLCFLDFGLMGRLTPEMKDRVVDVLIAVGRRDFESLARAFYDIGEREGAVDLDAFIADTWQIAEHHLEEMPLSEVDIGGLFRDLIAAAMRHKMRVPTTYTMVFKALVTIEGLGRRLAPDMDLVDEAQPVVAELIKERYSPERILRRFTETGWHLQRLARQFPPAMTRFLEDMDAGRVTVRIDSPRLEEFIADRRRGDRMWALGAGHALLLLSGTLALGYDTHTIFGLPAVSFVFYLLAIPAGALFLRSWWLR